jgi:hypothetical protein
VGHGKAAADCTALGNSNACAHGRNTTPFGELPVHRDDAQRELAGALDHRCLHRTRFAADMRGQLGPRLAHQSRFLGALIELRQGDWAVCRAYPLGSCSMRPIGVFEHLCYP